MENVHANADHDRIALPLEQDARDLRADQQHVVWPFERHTATGESEARRQRFVNVDRTIDRSRLARRGERQLRQRLCDGDTRDKREARCCRILPAQPHEHAGIQIADGRYPRSPLSSPAGGLLLGLEPYPLFRSECRQAEHVGVGRTGPDDRAHPGQSRPLTTAIGPPPCSSHRAGAARDSRSARSRPPRPPASRPRPDCRMDHRPAPDRRSTSS